MLSAIPLHLRLDVRADGRVLVFLSAFVPKLGKIQIIRSVRKRVGLFDGVWLPLRRSGVL